MHSTDTARRRLLAWFIDLLVIIGLFILLRWIGGLAASLYLLLRDGLFEGQSVGKRIVGLRVLVLPEERRCGFKESAIRNVLWIIPVMNLVMALTGLHALTHDPHGRHWGDRLANTRVVPAG